MSKKKVVAAVKDDDGDVEPVIPTWVVVVVGAVILLVIVLLLRYSGEDDVREYNGFTFMRVTDCRADSDCWQTVVVSNIGQHPMMFYYPPWEVADIPVSQAAVSHVLRQRVLGGRVLILVDQGVPAEVGIAGINIARITGERFYNISTKAGVYGVDASCVNASEDTAVIHITDGAIPGVIFPEGCIHVVAPDTESLFEVTDAFTLRLLGILVE